MYFFKLPLGKYSKMIDFQLNYFSKLNLPTQKYFKIIQIKREDKLNLLQKKSCQKRKP